jgi:hypothetical protein
LIIQQLVFQGASMACCPSELFRRQHKDFLFKFSSDHWVTRQTVCQVLLAIDAHRICKLEALGLDAEQILVLMWDVHAVQIGRYLLDE